MVDEKIKYFAYGSNMLSARLIDRCSSAVAIGTAYVSQYYISFGKKGKDGSGKAAIVKSDNQNDKVMGVIFEVSKDELAQLDSVEYKYLRNDSFKVIFNGEETLTTTYYIPNKDIEVGLLPCDWYRDIILEGAKEHGLEQAYIAQFESLIVKRDLKNPAHGYLKR